MRRSILRLSAGAAGRIKKRIGQLRSGADDLLLLLGAAALCRSAYLGIGEAAAWAVAGIYCIVQAVLVAKGGRGGT